MNLRVRRVTAEVALESAMVEAGRAADRGEVEVEEEAAAAREERGLRGWLAARKTLGEGESAKWLFISWAWRCG
jgi:hypothetical protein